MRIPYTAPRRSSARIAVVHTSRGNTRGAATPKRRGVWRTFVGTLGMPKKPFSNVRKFQVENLG